MLCSNGYLIFFNRFSRNRYAISFVLELADSTIALPPGVRCKVSVTQKKDHSIDMPMPRLPPLFHRPEIPQRVLPRRCIDYLRFRKSFSSRSLSIRNSFSDDGAMKKEKDSALFWALSFWDYEAVERDSAGFLALSFWDYEAVEREPNQRFGFHVRKAKLLSALRVKRELKRLPKDEWVEWFLDQLRVTVPMRRSLSLKFRRREYGQADVLDFADEQLLALGILPYERGEILRVVAGLLNP